MSKLSSFNFFYQNTTILTIKLNKVLPIKIKIMISSIPLLHCSNLVIEPPRGREHQSCRYDMGFQFHAQSIKLIKHFKFYFFGLRNIVQNVIAYQNLFLFNRKRNTVSIFK